MDIQNLFNDIQADGSKESLSKILQTIAPYVIVTGSCAEQGSASGVSDINFYVCKAQDSEIDLTASPVEDTYLLPLIRFFQRIGYKWGSRFFDSFYIADTYIPLEFSSVYFVEQERFSVNICGVSMTAAKRLKC